MTDPAGQKKPAPAGQSATAGKSTKVDDEEETAPAFPKAAKPGFLFLISDLIRIRGWCNWLPDPAGEKETTQRRKE